MTIGVIMFVVGIIFSGIGGMSFRIRAISNKPAWGGATLPFSIIGILLLIVGGGTIVLVGMNTGLFK